MRSQFTESSASSDTRMSNCRRISKSIFGRCTFWSHLSVLKAFSLSPASMHLSLSSRLDVLRKRAADCIPTSSGVLLENVVVDETHLSCSQYPDISRSSPQRTVATRTWVSVVAMSPQTSRTQRSHSVLRRAA